MDGGKSTDLLPPSSPKTPGGRAAKTGPRKTKYAIDSSFMRNITLAHTVNTQACLDWYYWGGLKDIWVGTICNNMGWFRGAADNYKDSAACYEKCYGCLTQSIQAGSMGAICRDGHGYGVQKVLTGEQSEPNK
ncbi:MAG: hypothetical protein Q9213_003033 [Squamulea squamosa]